MARIEQKLMPSGGNALLRSIVEAAGGTYTPDPEDAWFTVADFAAMLEGVNTQCRAEEAERRRAEAEAEAARQPVVVPLRRPRSQEPGPQKSLPEPQDARTAPDGAEYRSIRIYSEEETVSMEGSDWTVRVGELLPRPEAG